MTMVSSGSISMLGPSTTSPLRDAMNPELLKANNATISLLDSDVRALSQRPTGSVTIPTDVYGKTYTRYGTPGYTWNRGTATLVLSITSGMPNVPFNVVLQSTTSGQPAPGQIATSPANLDSNGNWSQSYNVSGDPYWFPGSYVNVFYFYQGASYPGGTFIGSVSVTS